MTDESKRRVLITGGGSGVGFATVPLLEDDGYTEIVFTARSQKKADEKANELHNNGIHATLQPKALSLDEPVSVSSTAKDLANYEPLHTVILNAGLVSGPKRVITSGGAELTFAAALTGHHALLHQLLELSALAPGAHVLIAGGELARGDTPGMNLIDLERSAGSDFGDDRSVAAEAIIRGNYPASFNAESAYATCKGFVAAWVAEMALRLPLGMTINAVSPGFIPSTGVARHSSFLLRGRMKLMELIGPYLGLGHSPASGAARYVQASHFNSEDKRALLRLPRRQAGWGTRRESPFYPRGRRQWPRSLRGGGPHHGPLPTPARNPVLGVQICLYSLYRGQVLYR